MMRMRFLLYVISGLLLASGCSQNSEVVGSGERLEDSPKPVVDPNARPLAREGEEAESKIPPFVKAYFMMTWVEALYSKPANEHPNPNWQSPLKDPVKGRVSCTDCHKREDLDFSKFEKVRTPMVDELEKDKEFMVDLMKKWVARLNSGEFDAKARLKGPVTCLTCHARNPELE